jgi:hypothetical protein
METKVKRSFLFGIQPWALSLLTAFVGMLFLFLLAGLLADVAKLGDNGELIAYICYDIVIAIACFFICRMNPKSFWYVPILSNTVGIISAIVETNFWITPLWILICSGWVLSVIGAIIGAVLGRQKSKPD